MSWAEAMKENAKVASRDRVSGGANVLRSAPSISWGPQAAWLTRIKQPREQDANRYMASAEYLVRRRPD